MKLSELIKTVQVKIPKTDLVIEIKTELSYFEQLESYRIKDELERGKYNTCKLVVKWNLEDEEKNPLPIGREVIEKLPRSIIFPITTEINRIIRKKILKKKT